MADDFLVGVNYWPARTFVHMWGEFDAREIDRDFEAIASLGLRLVRFFLFWPDFQPEAHAVDVAMLGKLRTVFDIGARRRLLLMPTLLVGHMSGPNWIPRWAISDETNNRPRVYVVDAEISTNKPRDIFGRDEEVLEAERLLVRTVVERFRHERALWGWDICNEIDLVQLPDTDAGDRWLRTIANDIRAVDSDHPVTAGILPWPDESTRGFHRASHRLVDVASIHAYPLYDERSGGATDTEYVSNMIEDVRGAAGRPVMLTEFGLPTNPEAGSRAVTMTWGRREQTVQLVDESEAALFVRDVLPVARDAGALGAVIWCFADYDPALYGRTPFGTLIHERYFGIFDAGGRLKQTGAALRDFARTVNSART